MDMILDNPRNNLQHYSKVTLLSPYEPKWLKVLDYAACKINVMTDGSIDIDYVSSAVPRKRVFINTFDDFVAWMTLTKKHTFICNTENELDACISLCSDTTFKETFFRKSQASYKGISFYRAPHKLNITKEGICYHILDVSDLSREGYFMKPLNDADEILSFTTMFLQLCWDWKLVVDNNMTWSSVARNFLMYKVDHFAWPNWKSEMERYFQYEFYRWGKNSYHDVRTIGPSVGESFDIINSHLNTLKILPCHSRYHCKYIIGNKWFNPNAFYALYQIITKIPELPFVPFRPRMLGFSGDYFPDIKGTVGYMATQQEIEMVKEVLSFKEGTDFIVHDSIQVVPKDKYFVYSDAVALVEQMVKTDKRLKSVYQRFIGTMFHLLEGEENDLNSFIVASSSHVFDPMVVATLWSIERMNVWKVLMNSKKAYREDMDGGESSEPTFDSSKIKKGKYGSRLNYSVKLRDDVGNDKVETLIKAQRDKPNITIPRTKLLSSGDWRSGRCELNQVGTIGEFDEVYWPGFGGRGMVPLPRIGILLEKSFDLPQLTTDQARGIRNQKDFTSEEKDE